MAEFVLRDLHLVKKALAIAVLAIERQQPGPFQSLSDQMDMKRLLDRIASDEELAHYQRAARIAVTGDFD